MAGKEIYPDVRDKLSKLILRLGSAQSGEVMAAVAAIRGTLEASKLDLSDLAEAVRKPSEIVILADPSYAGVDPPRPSRQDAPQPKPHERFKSTTQKVKFLSESPKSDDVLSDRELDFLGDMEERARRRRSLTDAQMNWLNSLVDKVWRAR